ncbi:MAG: phage tail terminator protein [Chloroflexota bacterium]
MLLAPIVTRLQDQCPALRQVINALTAATPASYPSAYVFPLAERVTESDIAHVHPVFEARFAVEIMTRNATDAAQGGSASVDLESLRETILAALVGFDQGDGFAPIAFVAGRLISFEAGLCVWRDEFTVQFIR